MTTSSIRHDLYSSIHKGIRAFFASVLTDLGRTDWTRDSDAFAARDAVRELLDLCESHLRHEDAFVHPALEARSPGASHRTAEEHRHHEQAVAEIRALLATLERSPAPLRVATGRSIYAAVALYFADNLEHMAMEETENNRRLWETHDDQELRGIEQAIVGSIPPAEMMVTLRWMVPALSPSERAAFLSELRAGAPAEVYAAVVDVVRPHLRPQDRALLDEELAA